MEPTYTSVLSRRSSRDKSGFTLVEILLVVVIISLLAALAIPAFTRLRDQVNITRFASDLRVIAGQFEAYHFEHGSWPADRDAGELPPEMQGYIGSATFAQSNQVGGTWKWLNRLGGSSGTAGLAVTHDDTASEWQLYQKIDERIDDDDLFDGRFREEGTGIFVWVLEER